jgi:hypothetical protein
MASKPPSQRRHERGIGQRPSAREALPKPADPPADPLVVYSTRIPTSVKREVKVRVAQTGDTEQEFVARALRRELAQHPSTEAP